MIGHNHIGRNGRFGNQMFQYAATKGIAANRGYEYCIPPGPKDEYDFEDEENQHKLFMAFKLSGLKSTQIFPAKYRKESGFNFDKDLFDNCEDDMNLYGFFQSEKYFKHIEDEVREDFTFVDDILNPCNDAFGGDEMIGLHIRRTDYVQKQQYHPLCTLEYYEEALNRMPKDMPVMIVSDDPEWCGKQELFAPDRFLISESEDNIVDMCILSLCKKHIIANSTFSWWGAWLANSEHVIAPKTWFGSEADANDKDLILDHWERL